MPRERKTAEQTTTKIADLAELKASYIDDGINLAGIKEAHDTWLNSVNFLEATGSILFMGTTPSKQSNESDQPALLTFF